MRTQEQITMDDCSGRRFVSLSGAVMLSVVMVVLPAGCSDGDDSEAGSGADSGDQVDPDTQVFECDNNDLTDLQQELLDAHNAARAVARTCEAGGATLSAAAPLEWNCILAEAAFNHSDDMATVNFFNHIGSDGLDAADRVTNLGYTYFVVGENIAAGQNNVNSVMTGWLNSRDHCLNIMSGNYSQLGAALAESTTADYPSYWTAVFGRPH